MAFDLSSSLGSPGAPPDNPVNIPESSVPLPTTAPTTVTQGSPTPAAPDDTHQGGVGGIMNSAKNDLSQGTHLVGKAFGHILSGLSGTEQNYTVDPATGKTIVTSTKAPPGQWARGVLAAGLLGSGGIGPEHGEKNFAQGLLAGLSGGANARKQMNDQQDAQKRAQAEQDYVNNLKAQENTRQDKELNLRETLNKAQVAHENISTAVQSQLLHESLVHEQGAASQLLIDSAKGRAADYEAAGEKPFKEDMTEAELQQIMTTDKGVAAKYVGLPTGQKVVQSIDPTTKQPVNHIETTYSLFAPLTKVPDTLVSRMKAVGLDISDPNMYKEMAAAATSKKDVDFRKIAVAQREVGKQFDFQDSLDKHNKNLAEIYKDKQEGFAATLRAEKDKYDFAKEKSIDNGEQVYNGHFNPQTGDLTTEGLESTPADFIANWKAAHNGASPTKQQLDSGLLKAKQDRNDLNGYMDRMNQYYSNELLKYGKPVKDAEGNASWTDPYAASVAAIQNKLVTGILNLHGVTTPKTQQQQQQTLVGKYAQGLGEGASAALQIVANKFPTGTNLDDAINFASTIPLGQGFTADDKVELLQRLNSYYKDLQVQQESNSQKQDQQNKKVQDTVNQIQNDNKAQNLLEQGAGLTQSD